MARDLCTVLYTAYIIHMQSCDSAVAIKQSPRDPELAFTAVRSVSNASWATPQLPAQSSLFDSICWVICGLAPAVCIFILVTMMSFLWLRSVTHTSAVVCFFCVVMYCVWYKHLYSKQCVCDRWLQFKVIHTTLDACWHWRSWQVAQVWLQFWVIVTSLCPCLFIVYYCFPPFLTFYKSCGALLQTNSHCIMQSPLRLEEHVRSQQDVRGITSHFSTAGMFPQLIFFLKKQRHCSFIKHRVKTVLRKSFF